MAGPRRRPRVPPGGRAVRAPRPPVVTGPASETGPGFQVHERPAPLLVPATGPLGGGPIGPFPDLESLPFARLDSDLPLLLLPIRLETRYLLDADPPELRIRIYPDQVHVRIGSDPGTGARVPATPVLLPRQWLAIGYLGGAAVFQEASRTVATDLRTGPDATAPSWEVSGAGLTVDDGLAWLLDYDRAVLSGMAITVPLTGTAAAAVKGLDALLVVGVDADLDPVQASAELAGLLQAHASTVGFGFVPQGTPTNNTAGLAAGSPLAGGDLKVAEPAPGGAGSRAAAAGGTQPGGSGSETDLPEAGLPDGIFPSDDNGSRLARALGLGASAAWRGMPFGEDEEHVRSRSMRIALFEAVLGTYLRSLLRVGEADGVKAAGVEPAVVASLRDWFIEHVTGGAPVPCLRVGSQPYGILPVRRSVAQPDLDGVAGQVERVVGLLIDEWRRGAAELPVLDPNTADAAGDGAQETTIGTILAAQPHPARFFARSLTQLSSIPFPVNLLTPQFFYDLALAQYDSDVVGVLHSPALEIAWSLWFYGTAGEMDTIDGQISSWTKIGETLPDRIDDADKIAEGQALVDGTLALLRQYESRQRPLRWLGLTRYEGALGEENTQLIAAMMSSAVTEWADLGLVEAPEAAPKQTAATYLADLRTRLLARADDALPPSGIDLDPQPLLYQLLDNSLPLVPDSVTVENEVAGALAALAELDPATLEWLMRETLGLGIHRLDAWSTSLASERLARLRETRPAGIQVGAFGWVSDLLPHPKKGATSSGYVLTPSLAHATTAAVLRSGYQAHGDDDPASPTAVDFRSHRVRTASWLLDGVRAGQELGALLGYRFERSLHDLAADEDIRWVRRQVLEATDRSEVAPDQPVDGIELIELHRSDPLPARSAAVTAALAALDETFDAVNDITLVEAVHQLTTGNHERATAVLDSMSLGTQLPPELRTPRTPLTGTAVEHRVTVLLDPTPPPVTGWARGARDAVAPALEPWVASLLPPTSSVGVTGTSVAADGSRRRFRLTLAELGLSALDAVYLIGDDPERVPAAVRVLAALVADPDATAELDSREPGAGSVSLSEFWLLAAELRRGIESWRVLDARDLSSAGAAVEPRSDTARPMAAVEALTSELAVQVERLRESVRIGDRSGVLAATGWLARRGISTDGVPSDSRVAARLHKVAARRLAGVMAIEIATDDRQPGLERRLAALLTARVPLLGSFVRPAASDDGVVRIGAGLADPELVDEWLDAVGRVRPEVARLTTAGMLSSLLPDTVGLQAKAGQVPAGEGESWAATSEPPPSTGWPLCMAAVVTPGGPPAEGTPICGLVVDRWVERIPAKQHVAGLAVQFDAPSNQPPQSWLLAVTPDGEPWSLSLVTATLLETLEWAMLRSVGPEDLLDYGRAVPTASVPGVIAPWPGEGS